jgi:hypothetical protein
MRTSPSPTRNPISLDEVRAQLEAFEALHKVTAETWLDAFRDVDGNLVESADFLEISSLYAMLAAAEA